MQTIVAYVVESSLALLTGNYLFQMELPVVFAIYALAHLLFLFTQLETGRKISRLHCAL